VALKLSVVRSFFDYLKAKGVAKVIPASTKLVSPPALAAEPAGRALTALEVGYLLSGPDRSKPEGARDYALMLAMLRLGLRASEVAGLRVSDVKWSHGRWVVKVVLKGGSEPTLPMPADVKKAIDEYLKLGSKRMELLYTDGAEAFIFQPLTNYRKGVFDKPLSTRMALQIVHKLASFTG
jgi:site-specific recombinase XerD